MLNKKTFRMVPMVTFLLCFSFFLIGQDNEAIISKTCPCRGLQLVDIDFEGLTIADYIIPPPNTPSAMGQPHAGWYTITNNPYALNNNLLNTQQLTGHGNILMIDGFLKTETKIFGKTLTVTPGKRYTFSAWFRNLTRPITTYTGINPTVEIRIGSTPSPSLTLPQDTVAVINKWEPLCFDWICPKSVTSVTPEIWLTSKGSKGNDLGVDNIRFTECQTPCQCGKWGSVGIEWVAPTGNKFNKTLCNKDISIGDVCVCRNIVLTFNYFCMPDTADCKVKYTWAISGPYGFTASGDSQTASFIPTTPGSYMVTVTPICGNIKCPPCKFNLIIKGIVQCKDKKPQLQDTKNPN